MSNKIQNKKAQVGFIGTINSSKRGQVGETVTWMVATVIIIVILALAILASSFSLGANKNVGRSDAADAVATGSFLSWLLTKDTQGKTVYEVIKTEENLNEFNGKLSIKVLQDFYIKEHSTIWLGIVSTSTSSFGISTSNTYLGTRILKDTNTLITQRIRVAENKFIEFDLSPFFYIK